MTPNQIHIMLDKIKKLPDRQLFKLLHEITNEALKRNRRSVSRLESHWKDGKSDPQKHQTG